MLPVLRLPSGVLTGAPPLPASFRVLSLFKLIRQLVVSSMQCVPSMFAPATDASLQQWSLAIQQAMETEHPLPVSAALLSQVKGEEVK